jgi:phosphate transport system protein
METRAQQPLNVNSEYKELLAMTLETIVLAGSAAAAAADVLACGAAAPCRTVIEAEAELDRLDLEMDRRITSVIAQVQPDQARELLSCMKLIIDVERITDLLVSAVNSSQALGLRVALDDIYDVVKMASTLDKMLADVREAYSKREIEGALRALKADSNIDNLRNRMLVRHFEMAPTRSAHDTVQVLFVSQALERAGDHVKNLAEEICHLVTGHSVRHPARRNTELNEPLVPNPQETSSPSTRSRQVTVE